MTKKHYSSEDPECQIEEYPFVVVDFRNDEPQLFSPDDSAEELWEALAELDDQLTARDHRHAKKVKQLEKEIGTLRRERDDARQELDEQLAEEVRVAAESLMRDAR